MNDGWKSPRWAAATIILATVLVYLPALRGGFVWDDGSLILHNPLVRAGDGLQRIWFTAEPADYYPVTNSFWWLQWRLWGARPVGYHAINILLHATNAVLVWVLLRKIRIPGAWLAALAFALHPVNVATVAWISEQKNTLSMCLFLMTILMFLKFSESHDWSWYVLALAAFLLALLSKSAVVMLPVVLLWILWWTCGRLRWRDLLHTAPFFVFSAGFGLLTIRFQEQHRLALGLPDSSVSLASHLAVAGSVPWFYLSKAVLPVRLTAIYPQWQIHDTRWTSYLLGGVLISLLVLFWYERRSWGRPLLFALGYFVVMLFPVMGVFHQTFYRYASVADHWQYYSIIAPIALVVAAALWIGRYLDKRGQQWVKIAGVVVLMALAAATWSRARIYENNTALWGDNVAKNPEAYVAHQNLGFALAQAGKLQDAVAQFEEALRIKPDYTEAHYNLGSVAARLGMTQRAIEEFGEVLRAKPNDVAARNNLANAFMIAGKTPEAVSQYERALELQPNSAEVHYNLGLALELAGDIPAARAQLEEALRLNPEYDDAQTELTRLRATAN